MKYLILMPVTPLLFLSCLAHAQTTNEKIVIFEEENTMSCRYYGFPMCEPLPDHSHLFIPTKCFSADKVNPKALPGGFIDWQIETALIPAACRPEQVMYYIDGIMVRDRSGVTGLQDNSFRSK